MSKFKDNIRLSLMEVKRETTTEDVEKLIRQIYKGFENDFFYVKDNIMFVTRDISINSKNAKSKTFFTKLFKLVDEIRSDTPYEFSCWIRDYSLKNVTGFKNSKFKEIRFENCVIEEDVTPIDTLNLYFDSGTTFTTNKVEIGKNVTKVYINHTEDNIIIDMREGIDIKSVILVCNINKILFPSITINELLMFNYHPLNLKFITTTIKLLNCNVDKLQSPKNLDKIEIFHHVMWQQLFETDLDIIDILDNMNLSFDVIKEVQNRGDEHTTQILNLLIKLRDEKPEKVINYLNENETELQEVKWIDEVFIQNLIYKYIKQNS